MTKADTIRQVKATVTVDDVLARYSATPLRRVAKGRAGCCPICGTGKNKTSRAFTVSADGHAWYCFGDCQRGGSVIDLVMALDQCDVRQALIVLRRLHAP
jgi:DNA primase